MITHKLINVIPLLKAAYIYIYIRIYHAIEIQIGVYACAKYIQTWNPNKAPHFGKIWSLFKKIQVN